MIDSREKEQVVSWLKKFSNLKLITRDRASSYGHAISECNTKIMQISDSFHLDENITEKGKTYIRSVVPSEIEIKNDKKIKRTKIEKLMYKKNQNQWTIDDKRALKKYPTIKTFLKEIYKFKHIIKNQDVRGFKKLLNKWSNTSITVLNTMAKSFKTDTEAVLNAVKSKLTNGLAEGTVNKIKTIKRMCYGKAKSALLKKRVMLYDNFHH